MLRAWPAVAFRAGLATACLQLPADSSARRRSRSPPPCADTPEVRAWEAAQDDARRLRLALEELDTTCWEMVVESGHGTAGGREGQHREWRGAGRARLRARAAHGPLPRPPAAPCRTLPLALVRSRPDVLAPAPPPAAAAALVWAQFLPYLPLRGLARLHAFVCGQVAHELGRPEALHVLLEVSRAGGPSSGSACPLLWSFGESHRWAVALGCSVLPGGKRVGVLSAPAWLPPASLPQADMFRETALGELLPLLPPPAAEGQQGEGPAGAASAEERQQERQWTLGPSPEALTKLAQRLVSPVPV